MEEERALNFIEEAIEKDIAEGRYAKDIHTRFPPEPNGFLHIGHATAICFNFAVAKRYGGKTNLRFDDTNPSTEKTDYVNAIKEDIKWLGFQWDGEALYASNYFDQLYAFAEKLIQSGDAYVDDSTKEEIAEMKGTPTEPGKNSPYRDRSVEENLDLFRRMKAGEFPEGTRVLRAKVDMAAPNMQLRDPLMYRIKHEVHHRTGDAWCIYPMYDFAHGQSDSIENITHSLCSLEFIHHRPLYEWFIEKLGIFPSRQIEFARRNVSHMITSKRRLLKLVEDEVVTGWDDPRMCTISGMRRKGYPAEALRNFCAKIGMGKRDALIEIELLESCVREVLNKDANRIMVVSDPVKLVISNYPEGQSEMLAAINNPEDENAGSRQIPFSNTLWIEKEDFKKEPQNKKYFRLAPGKVVRLKHAFIIECEDFVEDADGNVTEIRCKYFPNSKSGEDVSGIKSKGTLHWVSAEQAVTVKLNEYEHLFNDPTPMGHEGKEYTEFINPNSLTLNEQALAEPHIMNSKPGDFFQFLRKGYYAVDQESTEDKVVLNKTVSLKAAWKPKK